MIFELGREGMTGVDIPEVQLSDTYLGGLRRNGPVGLPGLSEPEVVRHYVRLSRMNYAIDAGLYPLGSCTMKHNPRLNEKMARLPGFGDVHPLQPQQTVQGALTLISDLMNWLTTLTGMPAVAMSPKAGAHGELCGLLTIRAALQARGEHRPRILVPSSAHGTNPATAALAGFTVDEVPAKDDGHVDADALEAKLGPDVAAIMLTNPNTCGLVREAREGNRRRSAQGGRIFLLRRRELQRHRGPCASGRSRHRCDAHQPAQDVLDAAWRRRTGCRPRRAVGGAGALRAAAAARPRLRRLPSCRACAMQRRPARKPFGRMCAFHGQMGMFVRALAYMLSHGADGVRQASEDAVLSANYILASLKDVMSAPFEGPCMHEALFDDSFLEGTGVTTLDFAKAMIDEGYHPMTMYFPLVVHGAMLIEPTESESKESLDRFIHVLREMALEAKAGKRERFEGAPRLRAAPPSRRNRCGPQTRAALEAEGRHQTSGGVGRAFHLPARGRWNLRKPHQICTRLSGAT